MAFAHHQGCLPGVPTQPIPQVPYQLLPCYAKALAGWPCGVYCVRHIKHDPCNTGGVCPLYSRLDNYARYGGVLSIDLH